MRSIADRGGQGLVPPPLPPRQLLVKCLCQRSVSQRPQTATFIVHLLSYFAGIVGLLVSRELLRRGLSVALCERAPAPCAGATGAGQGYIWMAHRDPSSPSWHLAAASKALWEVRRMVAGWKPPGDKGAPGLCVRLCVWCGK